MSEHLSVKGKVDYYHLPYREEGFTYCERCKRFAENLIINFNEGWFSDWVQVNCGKCKKAIWVCSFKNFPRIERKYNNQKRGRPSEEEYEGVRRFIKDDEKCAWCKKPTNHYDCFASGGPVSLKKDNYYCSEKCMNLWDKKHGRRNKK